jgi:Replication initiator protein A
LFLFNNNRKDKMKTRRQRSSRLWRLMGDSEGGSERHPPLVQVESNIEEWPVFQLGRSKSNSVMVERTVRGEDGNSLKQKMEVSAPGKYRLPGRFDYDVYSAVLELLEVRGGMPENGALRFSLHELILLMDLEPSGRTYEEVRRSLRRIAATVLESDNAFWSNGQRRHISDTFRLWDVTFDSVADRNGLGSRHQIEFGKLFRRSFEEHYLRGLDIEFFWELGSPVAKRLYRLVDLKRAGSAAWTVDLFELQKHIPLGPYAYVSKIKEKLKAAHEELIERGFLSRVAYEEKSLVRYEVSEAFRRRRQGLELAGTKEELIAIQLLTRSGLRGDVARDLVAKHGPAHCTRYANALPLQKNLRNPAGWLRRAIEEGFELSEPAQHRETPTAPAPEDNETRTLMASDLASEPEPAEESSDRSETHPETSLPDPAAKAAWSSLTEDLVALRGREVLPPWFEQFEGGSVEGSTLIVLVPNSTAANHLNENFGEDLVRLWRERSGDKGAVLQVTTDLSSGVRAQLCVDA